MHELPCRESVFPLQISADTFYAPYLRWLRHLGERLGIPHTLSIWKNAFTEYDESLLTTILSSGWQKTSAHQTNTAESMNKGIAEIFAGANLEISGAEIKQVIENTPPIPQIKLHFSNFTQEKEVTAFEALHIRFDGLAHLAETLIEKYGKQGEFIVYDRMVAERLTAAKSKTGSVAEFMENFTAESSRPSLFTAGLQTELVRKTDREAVLWVRQCAWARYFNERHPRVGYLMACSRDEVAYQAFNRSLRLQRTQTLMEGGEWCDFRVYTIDQDVYPEG